MIPERPRRRRKWIYFLLLKTHSLIRVGVIGGKKYRGTPRFYQDDDEGRRKGFIDDPIYIGYRFEQSGANYLADRGMETGLERQVNWKILDNSSEPGSES